MIRYISRAIYTFERAFIRKFASFVLTRKQKEPIPNLIHRKLSYSNYENRSFYIALWVWIGVVMRKGCWKTALELAKFLGNLELNCSFHFTKMFV